MNMYKRHPGGNSRGTDQTRKGRVSVSNQIYHITSVTDDRRHEFESLRNGRILVQQLVLQQQLGYATTLAYVVMPDHLHWLMQLHAERKLPTCVNAVKSATTRIINQRNGRAGRLWQKGFYDRAIRREEDIVSIARYIIANPVRAGLVRSIRDYALWYAVWV